MGRARPGHPSFASSAAEIRGCPGGRRGRRRVPRRRTAAPGVSSSAPTSRPAPAPRRRRAGRRGRRAAARRSRGRSRAARRRSSSHTATAAAQTTGLPPKVEPWSPGSNAPAASSATSSAPIGRPFASALGERDEIRLDAELLEREERAVRPDARLHLVEAEHARRARARRATNSGSSGMTPPSPSTGSSRTSPMSSPTRRVQRVDVVRLREADARRAAARTPRASPAGR